MPGCIRNKPCYNTLVRSKQLLGYALVLASAVMWGTIPLFTRYLYETGLAPLDVASVRSFLSAALAFLLLIAFGDLKKVRRRDIPFYIIYSMLAMSGTYIAYANSVKLLPTAMASVLLYTAPVFVNVLERIFYHIPFTGEKLVSLVMTIAGSALVVRIYDPESLKVNAAGIAVGVLAGFCYSLTTVIGTKAKEKNSGRCNGLLILALSFILFLPMRSPAILTRLTAKQLLYAAGLALLSTIIPYVLYLCGLSCGIDGGNASIAATVELVAATLFGVIAFGDHVGILQILGMGIVFLGVAWPVIAKKDSAH